MHASIFNRNRMRLLRQGLRGIKLHVIMHQRNRRQNNELIHRSIDLMKSNNLTGEDVALFFGSFRFGVTFFAAVCAV